MRVIFAIVIAALTAPAHPAATPQDNRPRPEQLLGDWQDRNSKHLLLRFQRSESVFLVNGTPNKADGLTATYTIDWSKNPVAIDFTPRNGDPKYKCILKIEGDRLTLAIPLNRGPRPTDFTASHAVLHYQRIRR
jgi:uncharacterized protein (TIGR03067 family)